MKRIFPGTIFLFPENFFPYNILISMKKDAVQQKGKPFRSDAKLLSSFSFVFFFCFYLFIFFVFFFCFFFFETNFCLFALIAENNIKNMGAQKEKCL